MIPDQRPALVPVEVASYSAGVAPRTIRSWTVRYGVPVCCDLATRRLLYDLAEVMTVERDTRGAGRPRLLDLAARTCTVDPTRSMSTDC